jgi:hypothetical protein
MIRHDEVKIRVHIGRLPIDGKGAFAAQPGPPGATAGNFSVSSNSFLLFLLKGLRSHINADKTVYVYGERHLTTSR